MINNHRQAAACPKHFGTGRHTVDPSDSVQITTAVTALFASAGAHQLQGGAPCPQVQTTSTPPYLDSLLHRQISTRSLRSTDAPRLVVPRTRTELTRGAFFWFCPIRLERPP